MNASCAASTRVLAQAIFREGAKMVTSGHNPMAIKRGIDRAVDALVAELAKLSKPTRDPREIAQVGTISANGDVTVGQILADAMERVGKEGVITVEENRGLETTPASTIARSCRSGSPSSRAGSP